MLATAMSVRVIVVMALATLVLMVVAISWCAAVGAAVGAVVGAGAGLMVAFPASDTVTRLEPVSFGVVSFTFGPMMGLLENLKKLRTLVGFAYLGKTCSKI